MALVWSDEGVVAVCSGEEALGEDVPKDSIVVHLEPEDVENPDAVESLRDIVLDRTIALRQEMLEELYELGTSLPKPTVTYAESTDEEIRQAEQRLLERLMEDEEDEDAGAGASCSGRGGYPDATAYESGMWLGQGGTGVRFFINHVDELVVHN